MSECRACQAVGLSRSVVRYQRCPDRDHEVIAMLQELAERYPERGFGKLFKLIRRRGLVWNRKRVWRVYCALKLNQAFAILLLVASVSSDALAAEITILNTHPIQTLDTVEVRISGVPQGDQRSGRRFWVTVVKPGARVGSYGTYRWVSDSTSEFQVPSLAAGHYEFRLHDDVHPYETVYARKAFEVLERDPGNIEIDLLQANPNTIYTPVEFQIRGADPKLRYWITIVPQGSADGAYRRWQDLSGVENKKFRFEGLGPGDYEIRVHDYRSGYELLARIPISASWEVGPGSEVPRCPGTFGGGVQKQICSCVGDFSGSTNVWGDGTYTTGSGACAAAQHAGAFEPGGSEETIILLRAWPGLEAYEGTSRNGIDSKSYGKYGSSFVIARVDESTSDQTHDENDRREPSATPAYYAKLARESSEALCADLRTECKDILEETIKAWFDEAILQLFENQSARLRFEALFSNPGAIGSDVERLTLFEAMLEDEAFTGELEKRLQSDFVSRKDIGLPVLDESALKNIAKDVAVSVVTNFAIESVAQHYESIGNVDAAYWIRTTARPAFDIGGLAKGLAAGSATVPGVGFATGIIWAKNVYSFVELGAGLNARDLAGNDVESELRRMAAQNDSIAESLMTGQTRGVLFEGIPTRELTAKEIKILQDQFLLNNDYQTELLKQKMAFAEFPGTVEYAKKTAAFLDEIGSSLSEAAGRVGGRANTTLGGLLLGSPSSSNNAQISLLNDHPIQTIDKIRVQVSGLPEGDDSNVQYWITLVEENARIGSWNQWFWVKAGLPVTFTFSSLRPGRYELRLHDHWSGKTNQYEKIYASTLFTVHE